MNTGQIGRVALSLATVSLVGLFAGCENSRQAARPGTRPAPTVSDLPTPPDKSIASSKLPASSSTPQSGRSAPAPAPTTPLLTSGGGPLQASRMSVQVARTLHYQTRSDQSKESGSMTVLRDQPPDCHCAGRVWWVRRYKGDVRPAAPGMLPTTPADRELKFTIDASGYIALMEEINRTEGVEVVFTPPLVIIPEGLAVVSFNGANFAQDLSMTVHPLGDRSRTKSKGPVRNEITYLGDEPIKTPAGNFTARRVLAIFTADLSPAKVSNTSEQWFVDGVGLVAERETEKTTLLGVPFRSRETEWALQRMEDR